MTKEFRFALNKYLTAIKEDYAKWNGPKSDATEIQERIREEFIQRFFQSITYDVGKKYLKVVERDLSDPTALMDRVHSFIVMKDNDKFKAGDILMAANYNSPATNGKHPVRGNIFGEYEVKWTGALYITELKAHGTIVPDQEPVS